MASEDFPFSSAKTLIDDGADWLVEMCLPQGHEQWLDGDETCLEQAVLNIERAIEMLRVSGTEQEEIGIEIHDGREMPVLKTRVTDPGCAGAADVTEAHSKPRQVWQRGGSSFEVTPEWISHLKGILECHFKTRLEGEAGQIDRLEDVYDATLC